MSAFDVGDLYLYIFFMSRTVEILHLSDSCLGHFAPLDCTFNNFLEFLFVQLTVIFLL
jgi:hypothetical protein